MEEGDPEDEMQSRVSRSAFAEGLCSTIVLLLAIVARASFSHLHLFSEAVVGVPSLSLCITRPIFGFVAFVAGTWMWWHRLGVVSREYRRWYALLLGVCSLMNFWALLAMIVAASQLRSLPRGSHSVALSGQVAALCICLLADQLVGIALIQGILHVGDVVDATQVDNRLDRRRVRDIALDVVSGRANTADLDADYWSGDERRRSRSRRKPRKPGSGRAPPLDQSQTSVSDSDSQSKSESGSDSQSESGRGDGTDDDARASFNEEPEEADEEQDVYDAVMDLASALTTHEHARRFSQDPGSAMVAGRAAQGGPGPVMWDSAGGWDGHTAAEAAASHHEEGIMASTVFEHPSSPAEAATLMPWARSDHTRPTPRSRGHAKEGGDGTAMERPALHAGSGWRGGMEHQTLESGRSLRTARPRSEPPTPAYAPTWAELYPGALGTPPPARSPV